MVSSYYVLKMIQQSTNDREKDKQNTSEADLKHTTQRCRACLGNATIPILPENNSTTSDILKAMVLIANIQIDAQDEFPKFLCHQCYALLRGAILFRKRAQQSDLILRKRKTDSISDSDNNDYISDDNSRLKTVRKRTKRHAKRKTNVPIKKVKKEQSHETTCPVCSEVITNYEYSDHMQLHKRPEVRVECTICKKNMKDTSIKRHMITVHGGSKYICEVCGKTCNSISNYKNHLQSHSNNFPFKCPHCPYRGRNSGLLEVHMRTHTRDFKFICADCPARFLTSGNLHKHMLRHKVPEHICDTCNKAFHTKTMLEKHVKVDHLGIKTHVCNICEAAFGYRNAMMKHQLKVHKREKLASGRMPAYLKAEQIEEKKGESKFYA